MLTAVVVISVVDTVDEAIELANASEYSLTASVWTKDRYKGVEVANQIRAGGISLFTACSLRRLILCW